MLLQSPFVKNEAGLARGEKLGWREVTIMPQTTLQHQVMLEWPIRIVWVVVRGLSLHTHVLISHWVWSAPRRGLELGQGNCPQRNHLQRGLKASSNVVYSTTLLEAWERSPSVWRATGWHSTEVLHDISSRYSSTCFQMQSHQKEIWVGGKKDIFRTISMWDLKEFNLIVFAERKETSEDITTGKETANVWSIKKWKTFLVEKAYFLKITFRHFFKSYE